MIMERSNTQSSFGLPTIVFQSLLIDISDDGFVSPIQKQRYAPRLLKPKETDFGWWPHIVTMITIMYRFFNVHLM